MMLSANSGGLVNENWGEYGTNGINGTNGKFPGDFSACSVAPIITLNIKDFVGAMMSLGLVVMSPDEFVVRLTGSE
jgi:hypothetical protein